MATIAYLGYAPKSPLSVVLGNSPGSWSAKTNPVRAVGAAPVQLNTGDRTGWYHVAGQFLDINGQPGARRIHVYSRSTGRLLAWGDSDASTGMYRIEVPFPDEVKVTCQDDAAGDLRNDLVLRTLPVSAAVTP